MNPEDIQDRLKEIEGEPEPTLKTLRLAQLLRVLFEERGSRIVIVGGSAIELLTDGQYTSGDIDVCFDFERPPLRVIAEVMGQLGATGGVRSFRVGGMFVDILGPVETLAKTEFREIGGVLVAKPEDLIAERVLMAVYPQPHDECRACAEKILAVALAGELPVDWDEAERVASLPEYGVLKELRAIKEELAKRIQTSKRNIPQ